MMLAKWSHTEGGFPGSAVQMRISGHMDPRRTTAIAMVLALHAALLVLVSRPAQPATPDTMARPASRRGALQVRLIEVVSPSPPARVKAPAPDAHDLHEPDTHHVAKKPLPTTHPVADASASPSARRLDLELPDSKDTSKDWSVGRTWDTPEHAKPRLPWAGKVYGAPAFHMTDPRMQGLAGIARTVQHLMGIPDSHCVDVDTWRGMSRRELHQHGLTRSRVDEIARRHGCMPPQRGDLSPDPFAH